MYMKLSVDKSIDIKIDKIYDFSGIDNIIEIYFKIGEAFMYYNKYISFEIDDPDENNWFVTLEVEFVILLEHLLDLCIWLNKSTEDSFTLSFYEQGNERDIILKRINGNMNKTYCSYYGEETFEHDISFNLFYHSIKVLCINMILAFELFIPYIFKNKLAVQWINGIKKTMKL